MTELRPVEFHIKKLIEWNIWKKECLPRLRYASRLKIPHLPELLPFGGKCAIVGAGPSVVGYVEKIKSIAAGSDNIVMSVNASHSWLLSHDLTPNIHVIFEPDLEEAKTALGCDPQKGIAYYIASHCAQQVFKDLEGFHRVLYHAFCPPQEYQQAIGRYFPGEFMVAGGYATFFRCLSIALILGYRDFELFGVDSSFEDSSHLEGYAVANREQPIMVWGADSSHKNMKEFKTQGGLVFQANEFVEFCKHNQAGIHLRINGDGLLRYIHESRYPEQYQRKE